MSAPEVEGLSTVPRPVKAVVLKFATLVGRPFEELTSMQVVACSQIDPVGQDRSADRCLALQLARLFSLKRSGLAEREDSAPASAPSPGADPDGAI